MTYRHAASKPHAGELLLVVPSMSRRRDRVQCHAHCSVVTKISNVFVMKATFCRSWWLPGDARSALRECREAGENRNTDLQPDHGWDQTRRPDTHVMHFDGDFPCDSNGSPIQQISHQSGNFDLGHGLPGKALFRVSQMGIQIISQNDDVCRDIVGSSCGVEVRFDTAHLPNTGSGGR